MKLLNKIKNLTQYGPGAAAAAAGAAAGSTSGVSAAGIGSAVSSGVAGGIGLISSIGNLIQNYVGREQNQNNWNRTFQYQKELNEILMNREDSSIQRRAADLEAAGINPMLAGLGGASAAAGGIINPFAQQYNPIDTNGIIQGLTSMGINLNEIANRKFSAAEADKNRRLEQQKIDIEKFNAETSRLQEENANKYKALEDQLANKQLDEQVRHNLEQEKSSVDQLNALMQKTANDYDIAKRNAKTAEERLDMDKINSEAQRKIAAVQGIMMNNRISYEEKEAAIKAEEHEWQRQLTGMELTKGTINTALSIFDRIKDCVFFWKKDKK